MVLSLTASVGSWSAWLVSLERRAVRLARGIHQVWCPGRARQPHEADGGHAGQHAVDLGVGRGRRRLPHVSEKVKLLV